MLLTLLWPCCSLVGGEIATMAIHLRIHRAISKSNVFYFFLAFQPCPTLGAKCRPCQVRAQGKVKEARLLLTCNPLFIYNGAGTQLLTACTSRIFPE